MIYRGSAERRATTRLRQVGESPAPLTAAVVGRLRWMAEIEVVNAFIAGVLIGWILVLVIAVAGTFALAVSLGWLVVLIVPTWIILRGRKLRRHEPPVGSKVVSMDDYIGSFERTAEGYRKED